MLADFFKLNTPSQMFKSLADLEQHFQTSSTLENVLFEPPSVSGIPKRVFNNKKFKNVSFSKTVFEKVTFTDCEFVDCLFIGSEFVHCQFHRCKFVNCNTYKMVLFQCYINPLSFVFDKAYKSTHSNIGADLFHELYLNSKNMHQPQFSAEAEILFRRWLRAQSLYEYKAGRLSRRKYFWGWIKDVIVDLVIGYGNRPSNFAISSIIIFFILSSMVHYLWPVLGMRDNGIPIEQGSLLSSMYYTTVVTTTLGFGDILPGTTAGRAVAMVLSIFGLIWLSLLTAIVIKKVVK